MTLNTGKHSQLCPHTKGPATNEGSGTVGIDARVLMDYCCSKVRLHKFCSIECLVTQI